MERDNSTASAGSLPPGSDASPDGEALAALEAMIYRQSRHLIRRLQQASVALFLEEATGFDVTPVQYGVLVSARMCPGIDQIGLSRTIGVDRTTIVSVVDRLEAKGLLRRERPARDRRQRTLYLTPAGATLLKEAAPAAERAQELTLAPLDATERAIFRDMLVRLARHHARRVSLNARDFDVPDGVKRSAPKPASSKARRVPARPVAAGASPRQA